MIDVTIVKKIEYSYIKSLSFVLYVSFRYYIWWYFTLRPRVSQSMLYVFQTWFEFLLMKLFIYTCHVFLFHIEFILF